MSTNHDGLVVDVLCGLGACESAALHYCDARLSDAQALWDACEDPFWMVWLVGRCSPSDWTGHHLIVRFLLALWDEVRPASSRSQEESAFLAAAFAIQGGPDFLPLVQDLRGSVRPEDGEPAWYSTARVVLRAARNKQNREDVAICAHIALDSLMWNSKHYPDEALCDVIRRVHPKAPNVLQAEGVKP